MERPDRESTASDAQLAGSRRRRPGPAVESWPRCPECEAPRLTHCPICRTVGTAFAQVEPKYAAIPRGQKKAAPGMTVLCPTCDEAFVAEHANRCAWCGYQHPDGYDVDEAKAGADEASARSVAVLLGVAALVLALVLGLTLLR